MKLSVLLSIIIPVYNTGKYLKKCLETVINQSYSNIEIIIINDASTDNSEDIINEFSSKYSNIKYYKLDKTIGVGNARNLGISYANGDYIGFIDSDDWIDSDFYEKLIDIAVKNDADVAISGIKTEYDNFQSSTIRYEYIYTNIVDNCFALHSLTNQYEHDIKISPIVNNRIYKKTLITQNNLYFDKTRRSQDNFFSFFIFVYAHKIALVAGTYYHYYQRTGSATHNFSKSYVDDYFYILTTIKNSLIEQEIFEDYKGEYLSFVNRCLNGIFNNLFNNEQKHEVQKNYISYIIKKSSSVISLDELIDYIDIVRFKRFLGL